MSLDISAHLQNSRLTVNATCNSPADVAKLRAVLTLYAEIMRIMDCSSNIHGQLSVAKIERASEERQKNHE